MEKNIFKLFVVICLLSFVSACSEQGSNVVETPPNVPSINDTKNNEGENSDPSETPAPGTTPDPGTTPEPTVSPTEIPENSEGVQVNLDSEIGTGSITMPAHKSFKPDSWRDGKYFCRENSMEIEIPSEINVTLGRVGNGYSYILFDSSIATTHPKKVQCLYKSDKKNNIYVFDFCMRGDLDFGLDEVDTYRESSENLNYQPVVDKIELLKGDSIVVHVVDGVGVKDKETKTRKLSVKVEFKCEFWGD